MTLLPTSYIEHCCNITTRNHVSWLKNVKCLHFRNGSLATILQHSRSAKEINTVFVYNITVSSSRYVAHGMCDINICWGKPLINVVENINVSIALTATRPRHAAKSNRRWHSHLKREINLQLTLMFSTVLINSLTQQILITQASQDPVSRQNCQQFPVPLREESLPINQNNATLTKRQWVMQLLFHVHMWWN